MGPYGDIARDRALDELERYLRGRSPGEFASAEDFADQLLQRTAAAYEGVWGSAAAVAAVRRTTAAIYDFYRLRDLTPFNGESPVKLELNGIDLRSKRFVQELDHFYLSKFVKNKDTGLRTFFREKFIDQGAAIWERESLDELRRAAGGKLDKLNDRAIRTIVQTSSQRIRNWAHVGSMAQAEVDRCKYVALLDQRTTELCREIDGYEFRVAPAQTRIEELNLLEPGDFAREMYENPTAKAFRKDPVPFIKKFLDEDEKTVSDEFVATGLAVPPLHLNCRTRLVAIIEAV